MQLKILVNQYAEMISDVSDSPKLDAECLIAAWLNKPRSFFYAYPEHDVLPDTQLLQWLKRRKAGEPVAYITGNKAFWDMDLNVTPDVLIPRPETECLVEWVLEQFDESARDVADLGTGSGAIACALARERSQWAIVATDQSLAALDVAEKNAAAYDLKQIQFHHGDWCAALPAKQFDLIVSNPPYIAESDPALEAMVRRYEPRDALIAAQQGLADIATIAEQAKTFLKTDAALVIEHGYQQAQAVQDIFTRLGYQRVATHTDLNELPRFTVGFH